MKDIIVDIVFNNLRICWYLWRILEWGNCEYILVLEGINLLWVKLEMFVYMFFYFGFIIDFL